MTDSDTESFHSALGSLSDLEDVDLQKPVQEKRNGKWEQPDARRKSSQRGRDGGKEIAKDRKGNNFFEEDERFLEHSNVSGKQDLRPEKQKDECTKVSKNVSPEKQGSRINFENKLAAEEDRMDLFVDRTELDKPLHGSRSGGVLNRKFYGDEEHVLEDESAAVPIRPDLVASNAELGKSGPMLKSDVPARKSPGSMGERLGTGNSKSEKSNEFGVEKERKQFEVGNRKSETWQRGFEKEQKEVDVPDSVIKVADPEENEESEGTQVKADYDGWDDWELEYSESNGDTIESMDQSASKKVKTEMKAHEDSEQEVVLLILVLSGLYVYFACFCTV